MVQSKELLVSTYRCRMHCHSRSPHNHRVLMWSKWSKRA
uniref:Uncharacterized protein n=1 Tax=Ascaris lumbricoides TaxID=6252 RepID=A0A0M3HLD9_ASCLU